MSLPQSNSPTPLDIEIKLSSWPNTALIGRAQNLNDDILKNLALTFAQHQKAQHEEFVEFYWNKFTIKFKVSIDENNSYSVEKHSG